MEGKLRAFNFRCFLVVQLTTRSTLPLLESIGKGMPEKEKEKAKAKFNGHSTQKSIERGTNNQPNNNEEQKHKKV